MPSSRCKTADQGPGQTTSAAAAAVRSSALRLAATETAHERITEEALHALWQSCQPTEIDSRKRLAQMGREGGEINKHYSHQALDRPSAHQSLSSRPRGG